MQTVIKKYYLLTFFLLVLKLNVSAKPLAGFKDSVNLIKFSNIEILNGLSPNAYSLGLTYEILKSEKSYYGGIKYFLNRTSDYNFTPSSLPYRFHKNNITRFGIYGGIKKYIGFDYNNKIISYVRLNFQGSVYDFGYKTYFDDMIEVRAKKNYVLESSLSYGMKYKVFDKLYFSTSIGLQAGLRFINYKSGVGIEKIEYTEISRNTPVGTIPKSPFYWSFGLSYSL